jgi:hypothetical protein
MSDVLNFFRLWLRLHDLHFVFFNPSLHLVTHSSTVLFEFIDFLVFVHEFNFQPFNCFFDALTLAVGVVKLVFKALLFMSECFDLLLEVSSILIEHFLHHLELLLIFLEVALHFVFFVFANLTLAPGLFFF